MKNLIVVSRSIYPKACIDIIIKLDNIMLPITKWELQNNNLCNQNTLHTVILRNIMLLYCGIKN